VIISNVLGDNENDDVEDDVAAPEAVGGGEMTNHRTEEPILAASTAVISPNPPGGEITTKLESAASAVDDMASEDGDILRVVTDGIMKDVVVCATKA